MSNRITYQDNVVTAKRFVQIGSDPVSARRKLNEALLAYKEIDNTLAFKEVEKMVSDNSITPDEKVALKERWDTVTASYTGLIRSLENSGMTDLQGVDELKVKYAEVYILVEQILADMESTTETPKGFTNKWDSLREQLYAVSQTYSALAYKLQEFRLLLETNHYYLGEEETAVITATLYKGVKVYAGDDLEAIVGTIKWTIIGLTNPEKYISGMTVSVPYDDFDTAIYVSATVDIPVEDL